MLLLCHDDVCKLHLCIGALLGRIDSLTVKQEEKRTFYCVLLHLPLSKANEAQIG